MAYAATFDVQAPAAFDKAQVILRVVVAILVAHFLSFLTISGMYLILPVVAALLISQKGPERYLAEAESGPVTWLRYLMMFYGYMALATDRLQTEKPEEVVQLSVRPTGQPTVGQALLRLLLAIPHAIILALLGIVFIIVWLVAAVSIILNGVNPDWAVDFMRGYLRWVARLLAYMASLVDEYPPFSFENGAAPAEAPPAPPEQA